MKILLSLFTCFLLLSRCDEKVKPNSLIINSESFITYGGMLKGIDSLLCNKIKFEIVLNKRDTIHLTNRCSSSNVFICGNRLSFSNTDQSRTSFKQSDAELKEIMEEYIMNPQSREDLAENPNKAALLIAFNKEAKSIEVFEQLNRLNKMYKQIRKKYKLKNNMVVHFKYEKNFIPSPPSKTKTLFN